MILQEILQQERKELGERVIKKKKLKTTQKTHEGNQFPKISYKFVDVESVVNKHRKHIDLMKDFFGQNVDEPAIIRPGDELHAEIADADLENAVIEIQPYMRYNQDFFYIAPFHHVTFSTLDKLIVLDLDLEFR